MNYKIAVLSIALAFSSSTFAGFSGPGGTAPSVSTVKLVSEMNDDTKVILEGRLVNQLKDEHYTFKDATGEIEIEIKNQETLVFYIEYSDQASQNNCINSYCKDFYRYNDALI